MKILWIDLNSSYAHSSLALPALHAQIAKNNSVKWEIVSATINENVGMIVDEIYRHQPDIIAATTWLFNHEQLLLSLIHISEPTRQAEISYAVFCLKKKKNTTPNPRDYA